MKIVVGNVSNTNPNELDITLQLEGFSSAAAVAAVFAELEPLVAAKQKLSVIQLLMIVASLLSHQ